MTVVLTEGGESGHRRREEPVKRDAQTEHTWRWRQRLSDAAAATEHPEPPGAGGSRKDRPPGA